MKQKDIILIIVVAFISGVISIVISSILISSPKNRQQQVEIIEPISAEFSKPSEKYFNDQSIDPTQLIQIGDNANPQPIKNP